VSKAPWPFLIDNELKFLSVSRLDAPPFGEEAFETNPIMPDPCDFH
jgi:hypothetical protein